MRRSAGQSRKAMPSAWWFGYKEAGDAKVDSHSMTSAADPPILSFESAADLQRWLDLRHATSKGVWLRIYMAGVKIPSVTFLEALDEGLCFGSSESTRWRGDELWYLQPFTPRRAVGTAPQRNRDRSDRLIREGKTRRHLRHVAAESNGSVKSALT
jgi:uncharacterized protein YdeI (YjbR/CyaY-like superfamily)